MPSAEPTEWAEKAADRHPYIVEIKGNSLDDGPGIRSVIFMKGCPLRCVWCHNPESRDSQPQLMFEASRCAGLHDCVAVCRYDALDLGHPGFVVSDRCTLCWECTDVCVAKALRRIGDRQGISEIVSTVLKYRTFYDHSGGGVTLSGGEPTMYPGYISRLAAALKSEQIHVLIETSGWFDADWFCNELLPHLDLIYFDLKLADSDEHMKYCGVENSKIIDNFELIVALKKQGQKWDILPRVPLVPEITATPKNLEAIADLLHQCGVPEVMLLPYNSLWGNKAEGLGIKPEYTRQKQMDDGDLAECAAIFLRKNIRVL